VTEEEFATKSTEAKWQHIKTTMDYIVGMDNAYNMRLRLNPHHPEEHKKEEQRRLRVDQYQRWAHIKALYSINRDELSNTLGMPEYEEAKSIMERIFSTEVDDALREIVGEE
jgi:hypothetical protein